MIVCQITDTHLFESPDEIRWDINVNESLRAVIERVKTENPDLVLFTGDCSHDGSIESYRRLTNHFNEFDCPVYVIPGNHDNLDHFDYLVLNKTKLLEKDSWQFIFLDSIVSGQDDGWLQDEEIAFLNNEIDESKNIAVVMHHNPIPVNPMADRYMIKNHEVFLKAVQCHPAIKLVLFGHVHCSFEQEYKGIHFLSAPSTCVNFQSGAEDLQHLKDNINPGYRWIKLNEDGAFKSYVKNL